MMSQRIGTNSRTQGFRHSSLLARVISVLLAGLMNALTSMNYAQPLLLPGMVQKTSKTDRFILSQMQLQRFNGSTRLWVPFGRLIEARPR